MKPLARLGDVIAALDIGTTKICCFIARAESDGPKVVGIGHQVARGVKNGVVVDLDAAGQSILNAVHAAEQMAGETISEVVVNLSGGFPPSRLQSVEISVAGREIADREMLKVLDRGYATRDPEREVIHSIPVGFSIDGSRGIRDPRGMVGEKLGVNMHIVGATPSALRNLTAAVGRCRLEIAGVVVGPYAAGLASLVEDETQLGVTVIDMGGGTTSIGVFFDGNLIFCDSVPVGGAHVTQDIARGLSTPLVHAERMKTLYGHAIRSPADDRETLAVPAIGEEEDAQVNHVPKSLLVGIIGPRLEETFELVRERLERSGFDKLAGRRIVLTGGACQLPGTRELASLILDKQIRVGKPSKLGGLAESMHGPAFSTCAGLLRFALSERAEIPRPARSTAESAGVFGRFGLWLKENF